MSETNIIDAKMPTQKLARRRFRFGRWLHGVRQLLALLLLVAVLLYGILQTKSVQNWAIQKTTSYLSKELQTTVKIDRIDVSLFSKLVLQGFYIQSLKGDTLLYAKKLKANFDLNPINLLKNNWVIDEITLDDATLQLQRNSNDSTYNTQFLIDFFSTPYQPNTQKKKPIHLSINDLYFTKTHFVKDDHLWGQRMDWYVAEGAVHFDKVDLPNNRIDIRSIELLQPDVKIADFAISPLAAIFQKNQLDANALRAPIKADSTEKPFLLAIRRFKLDDGRFDFDNFATSPVRTLPTTEMDYNHLRVQDINMDIQNFKFTEDVFSATIYKMAAKEQCGFELSQLSASHAEITPRQTRFEGLQLRTPQSKLGDTLTFKYRTYDDWKHDFNDRVLMEGNLKATQLSIADLMIFAPQLRKQDFFVKNKSEIFELDGLLQGKVNSLRGKNFSIKLGQNLFLKGDFSSRNLAVKNEEMLNLKLDRLLTDMTTLRRLIPNFHPPTEYDRLGKLNFNGRFDGFFSDFVAFGDLKTDLGRAQLDMRMNLQSEKRKANYSGKLALLDFDLGRWTSNADIGKITFRTEVRDGQGLTLETASAQLKAKIENFTFKKYRYENINFEGKLNKNLFDGNFSIHDEPMDLDFKGTIDFQEPLPKFDFFATVRRLDLHKLNLIPQNFLFAGIIDFNFQGSKISNIKGTAKGKKLSLRDQTSGENYRIDSLYLTSFVAQGGKKQFDVSSELFKATVAGYEDISNLTPCLQNFISKNYPKIANKLALRPATVTNYTEIFDFALHVKDLKNWTQLLAPNFDTLIGLTANGYFNSTNDSLKLSADVEKLRYDNVETNNVALTINSLREESKVFFIVYKTILNGKQEFAPISAISMVNGDSIKFGITATNFTSLLDNLSLNGVLTFEPNYYQIRFLPSNLVVMHDSWNMKADNYLRFDKNFISTQNLVLQNKNRLVALRTFNEDKGLELTLENFNLHYLDELWDDDRMNFSGKYKVVAKAENIFELKKLSLVAHSDSFFVNDNHWGVMNASANAADLKSIANATLSVAKGDEKIDAVGFFVLPKSNRSTIYRGYPDNYYEMNATLSNFPLQVAEYFIGDNISRTVGKVDAKVTLNGELDKKPNFSGQARISKAALTINYLQTRYTIDDQICKISNTMFDATGAILKDTIGNTAVLGGGITHDHLRNFGLNVSIKSPKLLVLNTTNKDNSTYYGYGIGSVDVGFTGSFKQTDLALSVVAGKGTKLFIPVNYGQDGSSSSFLHFKIKNSAAPKKNTSVGTELKGISVDMRASFTEEAEVQLIFDERTGDIIKGKGRGNIQLLIPRSGSVTMYGNYEIEVGEYRFTTLDNFINKPFKVKRGGNIRWTGDPLNAQISLDAEYRGLNTSPYNFMSDIIEPLNDATLKSVARKATTIDLVLQLRGRLLQPEIQFDINFPNLPAELRTYMDNKLRLVRQDPNELNRQVFGLMVLGSFLPANQNLATLNTGVAAAVNTASELILSQASMYVSQLMADIFKGKIISDAAANFNYNRFQTGELGNPDNFSKGEEFQGRLKFNFLEDRLEVEVGLISGSSAAAVGSGTYFGNDVVANWYITPQRTLKIKAYNRTDQVLFDIRNRTGVGISFRRDFDTFRELWSKKPLNLLNYKNTVKLKSPKISSFLSFTNLQT